MNQDRSFNQEVVHDSAALLFWTLADAIGLAEASEYVISTAGRCLMEMPFTDAVLGQYDFHKIPQLEQKRFCSAIAAEAEKYAVRGENMDGIIYAEDSQSGRSPSAQQINTDLLKALPKSITTTGVKLEKIGTLCLRHPLPAVVFSKRKPCGRILEVGDTVAALGFHLPMFLTDIASIQLADSSFVTTGIFHIPVPNIHRGNLWSAAIQNSTRFVSGFSIYGDVKITVSVEW